MITIGSLDFNYSGGCRIIGTFDRSGRTKPDINMKKNILLAVPVSAIAVAALVLSFRSSVNAESLIGYASVLTLVGVAALEYRISWRRLFGRG
jgi:hypothetical protein